MGDSVCRKCSGGDWRKCEHWAVDTERGRPAPADPEVMLCARWKAQLGLCHACSLRKTRTCLPDPDGCADYMPERVRCDICSHGMGGDCGLSRTPPKPDGAGCPDFEKTAGLGFRAGKEKEEQDGRQV